MTPDTFKATRERLGLSQAAFARALGIASNTANAYENGRSKIPRYIALASAAVLNGLKPVGDEMSDIENELRALGDEHLTGYSRPRRQVAEVLWSAADEIERLRAQLDAALSVGPWSEPNDYAAGWNDALDAIRVAIAGDDA